MSMLAMKFGIKLREAREKKKLSQEELAAELGPDVISRISIAKYETGKLAPNLETAAVLAEHLEFSIDEVVQEVKNATLSNALENLEDSGLRRSLELARDKAKNSEG